MIKSHAILIATISGIFGLIMGIFVTALVSVQSNIMFTKLGPVAKTEAAIETKVELLEHLRSGRYNNATRQVEEWLDNDLIGAGTFARDGIEFSASTLKAVEKERKARGISGYEPANASVSAAVQEAFRRVSQTEIGER